jgi:Ca2+-binding EF-hand superfamily protein
MEFKKGLIDKQLQGQLSSVFQTFDTDKKDALTLPQFQTYLYAIGMEFLNKQYSEQVLQVLFEGKENKRVTFNSFFMFLESNSIHEYTPEQFDKDMNIFDEDRNGVAVIEDINRVLDNYSELSEDERQRFVKICCLGSKLTPEQ